MQLYQNYNGRNPEVKVHDDGSDESEVKGDERKVLQEQMERQAEGQKYLCNLEEQNPRKFQQESDNIGDAKALAKNPTEGDSRI